MARGLHKVTGGVNEISSPSSDERNAVDMINRRHQLIITILNAELATPGEWNPTVDHIPNLRKFSGGHALVFFGRLFRDPKLDDHFLQV
jgi:hypothetical protein